MAGSRERVRVQGRELVVTNLDKVMYPETGTTKADVLAYYAAVAPVLIPAAANRPATRKRWVNGVGTAEAPGQMFFQKNLEESTPGWIPRASIRHKERSNQYPLVNDAATLTWLAQMGSLEIHVPQWRVDPHGNPMNPDRLVLDLDPGEGAGLAECVEVARLARAILKDVGLDPVPVTSGSKGIHLYAGLDGTQSSDQISDFAHELARALEADHPDLAVSDMKKTLRTGKVLVDWSQNNAAKTTIVPYSLRGRLRPTVAAPRTWSELASPRLKQLDYREVMRRVKDGKDPFAVVSRGGGHVEGHPDGGSPGGASPDSGSGHRGSATADGGSTDPRLEKYRSMRDPEGTPEPFSADRHRADPGAGTIRERFVIQEHHASRLHYDFRLERDGVLVSWALPKGVPTSGGQNHLAVQTEDHPMDYLDFEGTIPKGQYGAGTVTVWDHGYYECDKWIAGKEVIATLTGADGGGLGGTRKFALIRTGRDSDASKSPEQAQWLIHLMDRRGHGAPAAAGASSATGAPAEPKEKEGPPPASARTSHGGSAASSAEAPPPAPSALPDFTPMLASAGTPADLRGMDWHFELKWDGIRALIIGDADRIRLISRNGNDMSASYPELTDRACWPEQSFTADGEIIAVGPSGRPDFGLLQTRMKLTKAADVAKARAATPVRLMVFDLLSDAGEDLRRLPLRKRRERLERLVWPDGCPVHLSEVLDHEVEHILESARELGLEGIMAKRLDGRYVSGERTRSWLKLKFERTQEVVVGGWRPGKGSRQGSVGSLLVGIPDGATLRYVGRVGSGFSDRELKELRLQVDTLARKTSPFAEVPAADASDAHWVTPRMVGEVTYGEWTGGGKLRHPVWRGWRLDKNADDVVAESG
ncbi:ATP-dependent DNA ligase [Arthrobacter sp. SPG23]|uniref:ATP-dependent DNA ligase n=1 Tax=Arthrobacter sp. SPG23 TaxID=1610703 RepID=UPI0005BB59F4|nr:ATP-dependent DNA ligase [Arthrobacter sp. SPG23]KIS29045.1 ATP-dependent DNA ligase [Arthrobacter sp. SPG23]